MATTNHFQTRVLLPAKPSLSPHDTRLASLLARAQTHVHTLNELEKKQITKNSHRENQLNLWSEKILEKISQAHRTCLEDLKQSLEQLKVFQNLMVNLLNHAAENHLDGKKLSAIEHEICILQCLTFQLESSRVKIDGQLKLTKTSTNNQQMEICIADDDGDYNSNPVKIHHEKKDFSCRLLMHREQLEKLETLPFIQEFLQATNNQTTPERIVTIPGPNHLEVIQSILFSLYSSANSPCEIRILLHKAYAPLLLGKLGDKAKILREKYSLHTLTIHPTCAPLSTERVLLIQSLSMEKVLLCLEEIFQLIQQHSFECEEILFYDENNYDGSLAHEYGGYPSADIPNRVTDQHDEDEHEEMANGDDDEEEEDGVRRYSAFDAWNGSVKDDADHEVSVVKLGDDSIVKEFLINHGQFGALLGPHGVRIAQIRSQCRTVRIHTVAGSSIDTCSVKVIGPRADVNHAVHLIFQSIKEHDRKFPFKHHRFSGRLR